MVRKRGNIGDSGVGGRRLTREVIHVRATALVHIAAALYQKPTQHCKAIIFQLKINVKSRLRIKGRRNS